MTDDISYLVHILVIPLGIISVLFTVFIILNEQKLKETKTSEDLKRTYRVALYGSILILFIGLTLEGTWLISGENIITNISGGMVSGGSLATLYSLFCFYNATSAE